MWQAHPGGLGSDGEVTDCCVSVWTGCYRFRAGIINQPQAAWLVVTPK